VAGGTQEERAGDVGGRTGVLVAAGFVPLAFMLRIPTTDPASTLIVILPTLASGWLGGRMVGPWALRARTRWNWIVVVLRLALLAILIGAPLVALEVAIVGVSGEAAGGLTSRVLVIPKVLLGTALLTALGTTFVGPFVALATIPAATIWAALVRRQLRDLASP
jgi:hypothetical protein